jgi:hypothetical protein
VLAPREHAINEIRAVDANFYAVLKSSSVQQWHNNRFTVTDIQDYFDWFGRH